MKIVSVFSGCGGLDLGFVQAGFDVIAACDNDEAAAEVYAHNIGKHMSCIDVQSDDFRLFAKDAECDVLLGGFPCQGFSKAGPKQKDDPRNLLYLHMFELIERLNPTMIVAENVDGLQQNFSGAALEQIVGRLEQLGYDVTYRIFDAATFGVAQHRRRLFIIASKVDSGIEFNWPAATHRAETRNGEFKLVDDALPLFAVINGLKSPVSIKDAIGDLEQLNDQVADHRIVSKWPAQYSTIMERIGPGQKLCNVRHASTSVKTWEIPEAFGAVTSRQITILDTISRHRRHKKYGSIPNGNPIPYDEIERLSGLFEMEADIQDLVDKRYLKPKDGGFDLSGAMFCSGIFKRPDWNDASPTVLTNFNNPRYFIHPTQDRPFSLRECARLQGFPDSFLFSSVNLEDGYRLVGNAVPPPLAKAIAQQVSTALANEAIPKRVYA